MKKLYKCCKKEKRVKFVLQYETTKSSYFTNTKDKISLQDNRQQFINSFVLVVVLLILEKQRDLCGKEQKNMPTKIIIRKNKLPFMSTCGHVNITIILLTYLMLIIIPSTLTSLLSAKLEITQLVLIKQITGTFYFSRKHT